MEDRLLGSSHLEKDVHHSLVGIPVMDLQGNIVPFGDLDMGTKCVFLRILKLWWGAKEIETRLAHRHHSRLGGELVDNSKGILELSGLVKKWSLVGVNGDRCQHPGLPVSECGRPPGSFHVCSHLDNTEYPYSPCPIQVLGVIHRIITIGKLEMSVIVIDPHGERVGCRGIGDRPVARVAISARSNVRGEVA